MKPPRRSRARPAARHGLGLAIVLTSASCVPAGARDVRPVSFAAASPEASPRNFPLALPAASEIALDEAALVPLTATDAELANAEIPLARTPNPAPAAFAMRTADAAARLRSLQCLTEAVYYEARSESEEGQRAVAQVVLNRVRHPAYPASVCGVVYQGSERTTGCQFTFTCDGSLARAPLPGPWQRARAIAASALAGGIYAPVGYATHYHTNQVLPYWAPTLAKTAIVGAHIFYRWSGGWGRPAAFRQLYAGREPQPGKRGSAAPAVGPALDYALSHGGAAGTPTEAHARAVPDTLPQVRETDSGLPESGVREAYRRSGMVRAEFAALAKPRQTPRP